MDAKGVSNNPLPWGEGTAKPGVRGFFLAGTFVSSATLTLHSRKARPGSNDRRRPGAQRKGAPSGAISEPKAGEAPKPQTQQRGLRYPLAIGYAGLDESRPWSA